MFSESLDQIITKIKKTGIYYNGSKKSKLCVFYTNCHGAFIQEILNESQALSEYNIVLILNFLCQTKDIEYNDVINNIKNADILIYQQVYKNDLFFSTFSDNENNILKFAKPNCKLISITNPQNDSLYLHKFPELSYYVKEKNIRNINNTDLFIDIQRFMTNRTQSILTEKEKNIDVQILDYLNANYTEKKLFIDKYHPTSCVLLEISQRILDILNIPRVNIVIDDENPCNFTGESYLSLADVNFHNLSFVSHSEIENGNILLQNRINDIWNNDTFLQQYDEIKDFMFKLWNS